MCGRHPREGACRLHSSDPWSVTDREVSFDGALRWKDEPERIEFQAEVANAFRCTPGSRSRPPTENPSHRSRAAPISVSGGCGSRRRRDCLPVRPCTSSFAFHPAPCFGARDTSHGSLRPCIPGFWVRPRGKTMTRASASRSMTRRPKHCCRSLAYSRRARLNVDGHIGSVAYTGSAFTLESCDPRRLCLSIQ